MKTKILIFTLITLLLLPFLSSCALLSIPARLLYKKEMKQEINRDDRIEQEEAPNTESEISEEPDDITQQEQIALPYLKGQLSGSAMHLSAPNQGASVIGFLQEGSTVYAERISYNNGTVYCYHQNGWLPLSYVTFDGCYQAGVLPATITADELNMRVGPGVDYESHGFIQPYSTVMITELYDNGGLWGKLESGDWVYMEFVTINGGIPLQIDY